MAASAVSLGVALDLWSIVLDLYFMSDLTIGFLNVMLEHLFETLIHIAGNVNEKDTQSAINLHKKQPFYDFIVYESQQWEWNYDSGQFNDNNIKDT